MLYPTSFYYESLQGFHHSSEIIGIFSEQVFIYEENLSIKDFVFLVFIFGKISRVVQVCPVTEKEI